MTWEEFVAEERGTLLGGGEPAQGYIGLRERTEGDPAAGQSVKSILKTVDDPTCRRWLWPCERLFQRTDTPC